MRLYSVDGAGRRGVVFRAMEATDPVFAAVSRATLRLPYTWSAIRFTRTPSGEIGYRTRRRRPSPAGVGVRMAVRRREPIVPTETETAFTARWALHQRWYGRTLLLPVDHPPWRLYAADLLSWEDGGLLAACGLPSLNRPPDSVLCAEATTARFGRPRAV